MRKISKQIDIFLLILWKFYVFLKIDSDQKYPASSDIHSLNIGVFLLVLGNCQYLHIEKSLLVWSC